MEEQNARTETVIARDLRLNLERIESDSSLPKEDALLAILAIAHATGSVALVSQARAKLRELGVKEEEILEAEQSAALVGMLNIYYRFRHMTLTPEDYSAANLRMTALSKPVLGKVRFEKLAFAVSVLNGCQSCVQAHEKVLKEASIPIAEIHDLARIAAVVKGLSVLG